MLPLLQQRFMTATLASALLLPMCGSVLADPVVTALPFRDKLTCVMGSTATSGTGAYCFLPTDLESGSHENGNIAGQLRDLSKISVTLLAIAADVSRQAFYGWLDNQRIAPDRVLRLTQLHRTFESLVAMVGSGNALKAWLQHDSGVGAPLQLLRNGRDEVAIGLALAGESTSVQTQRGLVTQVIRRRSSDPGLQAERYRQYSITATEDPYLPSDAIEAGEILGYIRIE